MLTSTIERARPRLFLQAPPTAAHTRYRRPAGPAAGARGPSSAAGLRRRPWVDRLRRALAEDHFVLHYQPIVSLADGTISHHEALLRLADGPEGELVEPARFLPAAEHSGLIREIDRMVLDRVAARLAVAQSRDVGVRIAVNLSALSVTEGGLLPYLRNTLSAHRVPPTALVLEITETASICDMERAASFCAGAQALGCAVALDDFGVGFGAFHYLKHLPFRYLKIDGHFIRGLAASEKDQLVVKALVALARGLGCMTVAEYVEDRRTLSLLADYGVDFAQGFEVGRPRAQIAGGA
jgi:EAL domain-containing protein (putative c-di-GMP-specific phosphodiesterase class I)